MSRGTRQQGNTGGGGQAQQSGARRGNKTLGWYLGGLMPTQGNAGGASEAEEKSPDQQQQTMASQQQHRKTSLEDARCSPKSLAVGDERKLHAKMRFNNNNQPHQQHHHLMGRPRANSSASATKKLANLNAPPNNHANNNQPQHPANENAMAKDHQHQPQIDFQKPGAVKPGNGKENYWYYDEVSKGYYYENNGTRGWIKKSAKLEAAMRKAEEAAQKIAEQQKKMAIGVDGSAKSGSQPSTVPSLLVGQQQQFGKLAAPPNASAQFGGSPMAIKYFDNDGFFYEMASVDGWRRRQPGTTPPNSLASSFGTQSKAPSPIPMASPIVPPRRKIQPLQYQAYQQPPPQLKNTLDLQELVLLAAQQQQQNRNAQAQRGSQQCCCSSSSAPPTCCCAIAAIAAQLVLQNQQQMMTMKGTGVGDANHFSENSDFAKISKLAENIRQLGSHQPTVAANTGAGTYANLAAQSLTKSAWQQFPSSEKFTPLGSGTISNATSPRVISASEEKMNNSSTTITSTATSVPVGSFEEPYEFYWSGDETSSEMQPPPQSKSLVTAATNGGGATTMGATMMATSVSSIDEDALELEMQRAASKQAAQKRQQPSALIAPIGSEAAFGAAKRMTGAEEKHGGGKTAHAKRPDSLRLTCLKPITEAYVPISPGVIVNSEKENAMGDGPGLQHFGGGGPPPQTPRCFDVDKFIAELPPMPLGNDHEQILHSLRSTGLRTPMAPPSVYPIVSEPSTADSPLFTPIHAVSKNPWTYRQSENPWAYP